MDDSKSLYRKWLFNQTSIYKWLCGVPGKCYTYHPDELTGRLGANKLEIAQVEEEGPYRWEASKLATTEIDRMDMAVSKKNGGITPKWMVKIMENPIKMDDLGGYPLFPKHPYDVNADADAESVAISFEQLKLEASQIELTSCKRKGYDVTPSFLWR